MLRILTWQRVPARWILHQDPRAESIFWTLFAVAYALLAIPTGLAIRHWPHPLLGSPSFTLDAWYLVGFKLLGLLVLPAILLRWRGWRIQHLLLEWRWKARHLLTLPWAFVMGLVLNSGHIDTIQAAMRARGGAPSAALLLLLAAMLPLLTAALPEEILFRAVLQTRLEATLGRTLAILASAALFTAWHLPTRYLLSWGVEGQAGDLVSVLQGTGIPVFLGALLMGLAWSRWRSLPHLVVFHWAVDILPSMSSVLGLYY